jgi:hypothetical protein
MDIIVFALLAILFFVAGVAWLIRGEWLMRTHEAAYEQWPLRLLPKWPLLVPIRLWPARYDRVAFVVSGVSYTLMAVLFFGIAVYLALD